MEAPLILRTRVTDWRQVRRVAAMKRPPDPDKVPTGFRLGGLATIKRIEAKPKSSQKRGRRAPA